jgi:hypothetical protein
MPISEPGLGRYRVPRLNLRAFGKWIGIIPKARKTVGNVTPQMAFDRLQEFLAVLGIAIEAEQPESERPEEEPE